MKIVKNDHGGTLTAADFSFTVNGGVVTAFDPSGTNSFEVNVGTYTIIEQPSAEYATTYDNCTNVVVGLDETVTARSPTTTFPPGS